MECEGTETKEKTPPDNWGMHFYASLVSTDYPEIKRSPGHGGRVLECWSEQVQAINMWKLFSSNVTTKQLKRIFVGFQFDLEAGWSKLTYVPLKHLCEIASEGKSRFRPENFKAPLLNNE